MPIWLYAAAALVALSIGFGSGWKVRAWKAGNDEAASIAQAERELAARNNKAMGAAVVYEGARQAQRVRTITITREVEREVKADLDCSARPIPDGLRDALARAVGGDSGIALTPGAVPATASAPAGDVGGSGAGVRGDAGRVGGLRIPAEGAR